MKEMDKLGHCGRRVALGAAAGVARGARWEVSRVGRWAVGQRERGARVGKVWEEVRKCTGSQMGRKAAGRSTGYDAEDRWAIRRSGA